MNMQNNLEIEKEYSEEDKRRKKDIYINENKNKMIIWLSLIYSFVIYSDYMPIYFRDIIGLLSGEKTKQIGVEEANYAYYIPSILLPIFAGYLADYLGAKIILLFTIVISAIGQIIIVLWSLFYDKDDIEFEYFLMGRFIFSLGNHAIEISIFVILSRWFQNLRLSLKLSYYLLARILTFILINCLVTLYFLKKQEINQAKYKSIKEKKNEIYDLSILFQKYISLSGMLAMIIAFFLGVLIYFKETGLDSIENKSSEFENYENKSLWESLCLNWKFRFLLGVFNCAFIINAFYIFIHNFHNFFVFAMFDLYIKNDDYKNLCMKVNQLDKFLQFDYNKDKFWKGFLTSQGFMLMFEVFILLSAFKCSNYIDNKGKRLNFMMITALIMGYGYLNFGILLLNSCSNINIKYLLLTFSVISISISFPIQYIILYSLPSCLFFHQAKKGIYFGFLIEIINLMDFSLSFILQVDLVGNKKKFRTVPDKYQYVFFILFGLNIISIIFFQIIQIYEYKTKRLDLTNGKLLRRNPSQIMIFNEDISH